MLSSIETWVIASLTNWVVACLRTLAGAALILACVVPVAVSVYRLTFHPLAKYPGPLFGQLTDWYTVYHCLKGDRHLDFYRFHQRYGPIVRHGPNRISINTNTALRDIYHVHANVQKSQIYGTYKYFFDVPMSMTTIDKRTHAFKRRINVRALTDDTFKSMEDTVLKSVRTLCGMLIDGDGDNEWSSARNMTTLTSYVTSDIMGDMSFSRNWNVLESDENRDIVEFLPQGVAGVNLTGYMPIILHLKLDKLFFRKLTRDVYRFKALSQAQSDWRMAQGDTMEHRDILATLIDAMDPETGKGLSHKEIISEAGLLIIAGSDTMGTTITATLFYLLHNPQVLGRLQHEIWHTFANVEDIRMGTELSSCHYLTACLSETLRFTPPVGASLPREVCAGGIIVDGLFFPPGIDLSVPAYGLHHNETYFPDSFTYKPERWIVGEEGTTKESLALAQSAYHPFGVGRTSCIGKRLAYTEMSIIVARILWLFELRLQPGSRVGEGHPGLGEYREQTNEYQTKDIFVSAHDGPMIEFKRRSVVPVQEE